VGPHWAGILGVKANDLWSEVGTDKLTDWLDANGYEYLDKSGGRVPSEEGYAQGETAIDAVAEELDRPREDVEKAAESLDWWQEEIPHGTSGRTYVWAKKKTGTETQESAPATGTHEETLMPRKPIADMIGELKSWLPNYNHGPADYPTLLWRAPPPPPRRGRGR